MKTVIVGEGGHSKVVKDVILADRNHEVLGYLDDRYHTCIDYDQIRYGPISLAKKMLLDWPDLKFIIAIGNNQTRKRMVERLDLPFEHYATFVHPSAIVSPSAKLGYGTVIMANSVINADAHIGSHIIINSGAIIEHDNEIGDFVHVSPNATLTGTVTVGEGVHVGTSATVIPNIKVGQWSTIGAGATVIHDLPSDCMAVGVPARVIQKKIKGGVKNNRKQDFSFSTTHEWKGKKVY